MSVFRYRLLSESEGIIFCNLHYSEIQKINEVNSRSTLLANGSVRAGKIKSSEGTVYLFTKDSDYLKSAKKFKTALEVISNSLEMLKDIIESLKAAQNRNTSRLIHNLTSHNAHNIQEIYSLIPQENVSKKIGKQISYIENIVLEEPRETAVTLLRIAKNNAAMKAEFSVFRKLFEEKPHLQKRKHNVHKVLMNIFYLFFPDFTDKNVKVVIGENSATACFDYEVLHVAFYHIIENAAKYIKPNSEFNVTISDQYGVRSCIVPSVLVLLRPWQDHYA